MRSAKTVGIGYFYWLGWGRVVGSRDLNILFLQFYFAGVHRATSPTKIRSLHIDSPEGRDKGISWPGAKKPNDKKTK